MTTQKRWNGTAWEIIGPISSTTYTPPATVMYTDTNQTVTGIKTYGAGKLLMTSATATNAEPYSDANPPESLMLTQVSTVPVSPPANHSVLYTDTAGRVYVKDAAGTIIEITNQAGGGGGTADIKEVIVDFGTTITSSRSFVVSDASITAASQINVVQSGKAVTGRSADENEMDPLIARAVPGTGTMTIYVNSLDGPVVGAYTLNYLVG